MRCVVADDRHERAGDRRRPGRTVLDEPEPEEAAWHGSEMWGVEGIGEVRPGDVLADLIADATCDWRRDPTRPLRDGDVVVVTQKIVSKAEGRLVAVDPDDPLSHKGLVEEEAVRILRRRGDLVITETRHGFVCANAGVDLSNVERGWAALLPVDSDRSARRIRDGLRARLGVDGRRHRVRHVRADLAARAHRRGHRRAPGVAGVRRPARHRPTRSGAICRSPRSASPTSWPARPSW